MTETIIIHTFTTMITEVDKYRGYEIRFDSDNETFVCDIDDDRSVKKSFTALKKFIDEYLKDNTNFRCFNVLPNPLSWSSAKSGKIVGQRKDGRFVIEANGKQEQVSDYDLDRYWISTPELTDNLKSVSVLVSEISSTEKSLDKMRKELRAKYEGFNAKTLKEYKKELQNG